MWYYPKLGRRFSFVAHLVASSSMWLFVFLGTSCNNDSVPSSEWIAGSYVATTFTEPGQHDGGVDILANGGMFTARLSSSFEVEGRLVIPENIGSNFSPVDTIYIGLFNLDGDTLTFKDTGTLLDYYPSYPLMFIATGTRLESVDWEERGRWAIKIIMERQ